MTQLCNICVSHLPQELRGWDGCNVIFNQIKTIYIISNDQSNAFAVDAYLRVHNGPEEESIAARWIETLPPGEKKEVYFTLVLSSY